jgi:hypothetical protein
MEEKLAGGTCLERVWSLQTDTCSQDQRLITSELPCLKFFLFLVLQPELCSELIVHVYGMIFDA